MEEGASKPNLSHFLPLIIGGGLVLVFIAAKSGGSGPTVVGQTAASDIIAANEAANSDAVNLHLGLAKNATDYATAKVNGDTAVQLAYQQGYTQSDLARVQAAANEAIATTNANRDLGISTIQADSAKVIAGDAVTASNYQADKALAATQDTNAANEHNTQLAANAQVTTAQAQAGAQKTSSFWGAIGSVFSSILSIFNPGSISGSSSLPNTVSDPNAAIHAYDPYPTITPYTFPTPTFGGTP